MALTLDGTAGVSATGSLLAAGFMSAIGNIYAGNIIGNITASSDLSIPGYANAVFLYASSASAPGVSAIGNISAGNLTVTTGTVRLGNVVNNNTFGVGNIGTTSIPFNTIFAKATSAQYADLAEMYAADTDYAPGTVLVHGGNNEVTVSDQSHDTAILGVVSTNPSYLMNSGLNSNHPTQVALVGRVPVCVVGTIRKGDCLVNSTVAGVATSLDTAQYQIGCVIGKAIDEYNSDTPGVIDAAIGSL
jgi:hypothetical protein